MANRTVKFVGKATSDSGADTIQVSFMFDGVNVFNSTVPVTNAETGETFVLFEFDIDQTVSGNIPTSVTSSNGTITSVLLIANYAHAVSVSGWTDSDGNVHEPITVHDVNETYENLGAGAEPKLNIEIDGVGMKYDNKDGVLKLLSNVKVRYEKPKGDKRFKY